MRLAANLCAAALLAILFSAQAARAQPSTIIYLVPGVVDGGESPNTGRATTFLCTSIAGSPQEIRFKLFGNGGNLIIDTFSDTINHGRTFVLSTHPTVAFVENLSTPGVNAGGSAVILASSNKIFCSAFLVDAAAASFSGLGALHMVRFNPVSGIVE